MKPGIKMNAVSRRTIEKIIWTISDNNLSVPTITQHVFFYGTTLVVTTGVAFLFSNVFGKSDQEKVAELVPEYNVPKEFLHHFTFLD